MLAVEQYELIRRKHFIDGMNCTILHQFPAPVNTVEAQCFPERCVKHHLFAVVSPMASSGIAPYLFAAQFSSLKVAIEAASRAATTFQW